MLEENKSLKDQIAGRDKDLKKLKGQVKDNEDLTKQVKDLQDKYNTDTKDLNAKLAQTKLNGAINQALNADKVRNSKALKGLLNMDNIKLDEEGKLVGLDEQVKEIKKSDSYLFDEGSGQNYKPESGKPASSDITQTMVDIFKQGEVNNDSNS